MRPSVAVMRPLVAFGGWLCDNWSRSGRAGRATIGRCDATIGRMVRALSSLIQGHETESGILGIHQFAMSSG